MHNEQNDIRIRQELIRNQAEQRFFKPNELPIILPESFYYVEDDRLSVTYKSVCEAIREFKAGKPLRARSILQYKKGTIGPLRNLRSGDLERFGCHLFEEKKKGGLWARWCGGGQGFLLKINKRLIPVGADNWFDHQTLVRHFAAVERNITNAMKGPSWLARNVRLDPPAWDSNSGSCGMESGSSLVRLRNQLLMKILSGKVFGVTSSGSVFLIRDNNAGVVDVKGNRYAAYWQSFENDRVMLADYFYLAHGDTTGEYLRTWMEFPKLEPGGPEYPPPWRWSNAQGEFRCIRWYRRPWFAERDETKKTLGDVALERFFYSLAKTYGSAWGIEHSSSEWPGIFRSTRAESHMISDDLHAVSPPDFQNLYEVREWTNEYSRSWDTAGDSPEAQGAAAQAAIQANRGIIDEI